MTMLRGQCACGDMHYQADIANGRRRDGDCSLCRLASGEAVVMVGVDLPATALRWCAGAAVFYGASSQARHGFCAHCGSVLCTSSRQESVWACRLDDMNDQPSPWA